MDNTYSEERLIQLITNLTDSGECWFDHHGGCQEHGYLSLEPGELCPQMEAKQVVEEFNQRTKNV